MTNDVFHRAYQSVLQSWSAPSWAASSQSARAAAIYAEMRRIDYESHGSQIARASEPRCLLLSHRPTNSISNETDDLPSGQPSLD